MADVNSNININFDTAAALAQLRSLQAGLSRFHQSLAEGNLAAANAQKGLNAQLLQSVGASGKFATSQVKVAGSTLAFTSALEKNKLSLREYYRFTMAAATANTRVMGKAFAQEREIINRARRDRVKALQAQYIQMNKANSGFMDAIRVMPKSLQMAGGKFTELGTRIQYAAQRQQFLNQLLKQGSTQLLNFGKNTQWAGRQLMVGLTMPLALFGSAAAKTFRELEEEIVKFTRVYGNAFSNEAETEAAIENIKKLAVEYTKYGISVVKTVEMAATAAAAGFEGVALMTQVETATKLAVLGQVEQQEALQTTISLQSAFGLSTDELAKKIDFLNAVENQTLLSIEDLTIAIPKAAPVIKQLGGNVEDLAFFMTAMKEGGINASEGANALKSGLASLINPSDKASKMLQGLGINVKSIVEGNQGDIKATVIGFADALDTLDPLNRARAIEQMFGKFQFSRLSTLFQNVTKDGTQASRALALAGASVEELAILSEREMSKIEESVGVQFQAAVEQFKQTIMPIGKVFLEALTPVVKFIGNLFEKFNELSDNTKKVVAIIVGALAGIGPIVLMTFGLLANGIANVIKFFALLRGGIARLNGQTNIMGAGFNYMTQEQIENAASSQQLHQTHTKLIEVFNVEKTSVNALAASYSSLSTQMRAMAAQNPALFTRGASGAKAAVSKLPPVRKYQDGILSVPGPKGAGDVVPAMLSPGEAVIPTKTTNKYRGLISAMFNDKVPGFMAGRLPGGAGRQTSLGPAHKERQSGATFVGMPQSFEKASQSREMLEKISGLVSRGRFGTLPPTNFGTKLQGFTGYSFPERGIGGVFRKPDGKVVVVKPTIDEKTALAEVRATQIEAARGMIVPKQVIRTMMDPTDPTGRRKIIVLESPYDPRIASMDGKFTKSDMIKQLVGSTLRGDKDLQKSNVSGRIVADVGNAGAFDRASGFRDFSKAMPSMEQQAMINLLGVKGGARKDFAVSTAGLARKMNPTQYDNAIKQEIRRSIPEVEKLIKSWSSDLNPSEKVVYENMLKRLKDGEKTNWAALQPVHARADQGVVKAMAGVNPGASSSLIKEQIKKYALPAGTQEQLLIDDLTKSVENDFAEKLKSSDPERARVIKTAWTGGEATLPSGERIRFDTARQSAFLNEIQGMTPINVNGETRYLHADDIDSFNSDPNHRAKQARTKQEVIDKVLYRMGVVPNNKGVFVDKGGFTGRFGNAKQFAKDLATSGKAAGGGIGQTSTIVRPFAKQEILDYNQRMGDPLKTETGRAMLKAGFSADEIRDQLKENLSHIKQEVTGSTSGAEKMKTGKALYDVRMLNNYMNAKLRSTAILDDFNKNNVLKLTEVEESEFRKAAEFMKKGEHPQNAKERALLAKAVELDQKVIDYKDKGNSVSKKFLPKDPRIPKILQTLFSDPKLQPGRLIDLAATSADEVFVAAKPGERVVDTKTGKGPKITKANSKPLPKNLIPVNKKGRVTRDKVVVKEKAGQAVVTPSQAVKLRGIRGKQEGSPEAVKAAQSGLTPYQKQELKRIRAKNPGLDDRQSEDILRRKLKADLKIAEAKEKELARARKDLRRAEQLPKQQAALQAKADRIEKERQSRLLEASKHQDRANKMNEKIDRKQRSQQSRIARQEKIGRVSGGASMALGTAGMGLMMAGQQGAGMAAMGASAVAGMAPMLTNPYVAAGTAVVAVAAGLYMLERQANKSAKAQSQFVDATSATTAKMQAIGEMNDKVGASQIFAEKRSKGAADRYTTGYERGKQQFGVTFLDSEVGKDVMSGFTKSMASGTDTAAQQMAIQLAGYISDGVMSAEQAHSVASQIGTNLNNQSLTAQISGQLLSLVGPGGKDLLTNPIEVRVRLVEEQKSVTSVLQNELQASVSGRKFSAENMASQVASTAFVPLSPIRIADHLSDIFGDGIETGFIEYSAMEMFTETKAEAQASAGAASGVQNLEFSQAQIDSLNAQFDKEKKILETKKAATTDAAKRKQIEDQISALETKRVAGVQTLRQGNRDALKQQIELFRIAQQRGAVENAFFDSLKEQVRLKAEETGQGDFVDAFLKSSADLDSKELEVKINTLVASGMMPTATATTLLSTFAGDEKGLNKFINVTTRLQDPGLVTQLINSLGGIEGGQEFLIAISQEEPEKADKLLSTIARIQKAAGKEINFEAFMKSEGAMAKIEALQKDLELIEKIENPITREVIANITEDSNGEPISMLALLERWDEWEGLDDEVKKTVIQEYITLLRTISDEQVGAFAQKTVSGMGSFGGEAARYYAANPNVLRDEASADLASQAGQQLQAAEDAGLLGGNKSGEAKGPNPLAFLEPLAMRLKQVRDNSFNALKPVESLLAAFTNKKTQADAFNLFDGIQNRLLRLGAGKGLREAISSMSAEDFAKVASLKGKDALFTFEKGKPRSKDTITGLTRTGRAVNQAENEVNLGNFNLTNQETIANIKEQTKAYNMLIGSGLTAAEALDVASDQGQAAAIAAGTIKKGTKEWKDYIAGIKEANTALERQAVLNNIIRANEDFALLKQMPELAGSMKALGFSTNQISEVMQDPQLAKSLIEDLKDGKIDSEAIAEYLNNIDAKKIIDIQIEFSKGNLAEAAEEGRNIVDELFSAQEGLIRTGANSMAMSANDKQISELESQIAPFRREIELLNDELEDGQRAIEEGYSRPIEKLSEDVNDLNRQLEMSPIFGDRAISKIQDENSRFSNDLTIISNAAEEVNKKYDEQAEALSKVQKINEDIAQQQKSQIDLADALSSGDIGAAARIAQDMRAAAASRFASAQNEAIQKSRENAINSLTGPQSGLTQDQINKRMFENSQKIYAMETDPSRLAIVSQIENKQDQIYNLEEGREAQLLKIRTIEDKIYAIEEKSIEPLQERIDALSYSNVLLQRLVDKELENITVLGKTREAWEAINARIDAYAAAQKAAEGSAPLAGLLKAASSLDSIWKTITDKMSAYTKGVPKEVSDVKESFIGGQQSSSTDRAAAEKEAKDKAESDKKVADSAEALKKLQSGKTLSNEERGLLNMSSLAVQKRLSERLGFFANGGVVPKSFENGALASGTDTVPAMLTPGEYVVKKSAVNKYGKEFLDSVNVQKFAEGGLVSESSGSNKKVSRLDKIKSFSKKAYDNFLFPAALSADRLLAAFGGVNPIASTNLKREKALHEKAINSGIKSILPEVLGTGLLDASLLAMGSGPVVTGTGRSLLGAYGASKGIPGLGTLLPKGSIPYLTASASKTASNLAVAAMIGGARPLVENRAASTVSGLRPKTTTDTGQLNKGGRFPSSVLHEGQAVPLHSGGPFGNDAVVFEGLTENLGSLLTSRQVTDIIPTTPEGLLSYVLKKDPTNKKAQELLNKINLNNQWQDKDVNRLLENMLAAGSISFKKVDTDSLPAGLTGLNLRRPELASDAETSAGITQLISSMLGDTKATLAVDSKRKAMKPYLAEITDNYAESIRLAKIKADEDAVRYRRTPTTKTPKDIPMIRVFNEEFPKTDGQGDLFEKAAGFSIFDRFFGPGGIPEGTVGTPNQLAVARTSRHFTAYDAVQSHMQGEWLPDKPFIVSTLSNLMKYNGKPEQLHSVDSFFLQNFGKPFQYSKKEGELSSVFPLDRAAYVKKLKELGLHKRGEELPVMTENPLNKEIFYLAKEKYSKKELDQILREINENSNLRPIDRTPTSMGRDNPNYRKRNPFYMPKRNPYEVDTPMTAQRALQIMAIDRAKKQIGIDEVYSYADGYGPAGVNASIMEELATIIGTRFSGAHNSTDIDNLAKYTGSNLFNYLLREGKDLDPGVSTTEKTLSAMLMGMRFGKYESGKTYPNENLLAELQRFKIGQDVSAHVAKNPFVSKLASQKRMAEQMYGGTRTTAENRAAKDAAMAANPELNPLHNLGLHKYLLQMGSDGDITGIDSLYAVRQFEGKNKIDAFAQLSHDPIEGSELYAMGNATKGFPVSKSITQDLLALSVMRGAMQGGTTKTGINFGPSPDRSLYAEELVKKLDDYGLTNIFNVPTKEASSVGASKTEADAWMFNTIADLNSRASTLDKTVEIPKEAVNTAREALSSMITEGYNQELFKESVKKFGAQARIMGMAKGGLVPKLFAAGGYAKGTDTVPAMLTPGEFVMSKYAVDAYGADTMKAINSGSSMGDSVYNYSISVNVKSGADANEIARSVMTQIKSIDNQRIRGTRI